MVAPCFEPGEAIFPYWVYEHEEDVLCAEDMEREMLQARLIASHSPKGLQRYLTMQAGEYRLDHKLCKIMVHSGTVTMVVNRW